MASAARSGSYTEPSHITRLTARASCSRICAVVSSGTSGAPRRSLASSSCAAAIAASPPLTATYIVYLSLARRMLRGRAAMCADAASTMSTPRGNCAWLSVSCCSKPLGMPLKENCLTVLIPGPANARPVAPKPATCTISVLERSGYSGVPWLSVARRGMDCGVLASAKWASQGSRTRRAPVWKLANWQTASELAKGASSQMVVSKSASVMRIAAAVAMSGDGGARLVDRLTGSAGTDMARITVLKTAWESWTASRKPACKVGSWERMGSILPAHEGEKLHAGCGRLGSLIRALRVHAPHDGSDQHDLEPVAEARTLSERVDNGSKARPLEGAAKQI